jgi:hypothetical protein
MNTRKSELDNKRAQALRANLKRRKQAKRAQKEEKQPDTSHGTIKDSDQETDQQ